MLSMVQLPAWIDGLSYDDVPVGSARAQQPQGRQLGISGDHLDTFLS